MKECIKSGNAELEFYTAEKCFITELSNSDDDPELSIARARVAAGVSTHWHRLKKTEERYSIISGQGLVEIGKLPPQQVTAGDTVLIPAMCKQRITNTGSDELIFLAICTPRFRQADYLDLETTTNSN